mgnify:CR=1 FL=1
MAERYPHEFSGGQRQRIGIARALALDPEFIVADEPTSALDVSIRVQILNLLADIQQRTGISYLLISHDLAAVRHYSDEIAVLFSGRIVEQARTEMLFSAPMHPYTRILLESVPIPDPTRSPSDVASSPDSLPAERGCAFAHRCPLVEEICHRVTPKLEPIAGSTEHRVACHVVPTEPIDGDVETAP